MDYQQAIREKERHQPERRTWWQRWRRRPVRCRACGHVWPCPRHQWVSETILQLLRDELQGNAGSHW